MAKNCIDVYVKLPTGKTVQYDLTSNSTIEILCKKIADNEKLKATQVRLKYQGKTLNREHTMGYLGVRPETILKAEVLVARPVTLLVSLPKDLGETEVTCTSLDAVSDVIARLADMVTEEKAHVLLKFDGRVVKGHTLQDAGLVDGSALVVEVQEPPPTPPKTEGASGASPKTTELDEGEKDAILGSFQTDGKPVEVVFSFDTTGSMHGCLVEVRRKLRECCTRLIQDIANIRIGVIAHGDYCDQQTQYVLRQLDLTSDVHAIGDFVDNVPKTGGGDSPECYEWALKKAQGLDWSEDSAKAFVVIGDEVPHHPGYTDANVFWRDELEILTGMGVKVYGVHALNNTSSKPFYEEIADASGGHYLSLSHFDLITDMFLAVCYREAAEEGGGLEAFEREVEAAGRMTEERRQMFRLLDKGGDKGGDTVEGGAAAAASNSEWDNAQAPARYVRLPWWDPSLPATNAKPLYHYDQAEDVFSWIKNKNDDENFKYAPAVTRREAAKSRKSKKCLVM